MRVSIQIRKLLQTMRIFFLKLIRLLWESLGSPLGRGWMTTCQNVLLSVDGISDHIFYGPKTDLENIQIHINTQIKCVFRKRKQKKCLVA